MALRDKLRYYQEPIPDDAIPVKVEIGVGEKVDVLELMVSRRDHSPQLARECDEMLKSETEDEDEEASVLSLARTDVIAKRAIASVMSYRAYPKTSTDAEIAEIAWDEDLTEDDLKSLGWEHYWAIIGAIGAKLYPNPKAGVDA